MDGAKLGEARKAGRKAEGGYGMMHARVHPEHQHLRRRCPDAVAVLGKKRTFLQHDPYVTRILQGSCHMLRKVSNALPSLCRQRI